MCQLLGYGSHELAVRLLPRNTWGNGMSEDPKTRAREEMGLRIKEAREAKGISQAKLGAVAVPGPITAQSVLKWEQGKSAPNAKSLDAIAQLTGRSVKWFLYGVESDDDVTESQAGRVVPMVHFSKISSHLAGDKRALGGRVRTNFPCSDKSFQTYALDDANHPEVREGDSIVIDPQRTPRPGKLCMALLDGEPIVGRYRPKKKRVVIAPVNEDDWQTVEVAPEDIVGAVTEIARSHG